MSERIPWSFQHPWKFDSEPISFRGPPSVSLFRNRQPVPARERELVPVAARQLETALLRVERTELTPRAALHRLWVAGLGAPRRALPCGAADGPGHRRHALGIGTIDREAGHDG